MKNSLISKLKEIRNKKGEFIKMSINRSTASECGNNIHQSNHPYN
jgi:hypothetical protein